MTKQSESYYNHNILVLKEVFAFFYILQAWYQDEVGGHRLAFIGEHSRQEPKVFPIFLTQS